MNAARLVLPGIALVTLASASFAQPRPRAPAAPVARPTATPGRAPAGAPACGDMAAPVYEPGCEGAPRWTCDTGASLPAGSQWCGCDGTTVESPSMAPLTGHRYRFRGSCEANVRFGLTPERTSETATTGRVVVFLEVANGSTEATRVAGPCRGARPAAGELARVTCGRGRARTTLIARRVGDDVIAETIGPRHVEHGRIAVPPAQVLRGTAPLRW